MPLPNIGVDSLHLLLTGGAANLDPDLALGGQASTKRIHGLGPLVSTPIPGVRIDHVFPQNGEGVGELLVDPNGDLVWTPPGGVAGTPEAILAGSSAVVAGGDADKAILVTRETGLPYAGVDAPALHFPFNGALVHGNIADAERVAGSTTYRAVMFFAGGSVEVQNIEIWMPPVAGAQAAFAIGFETAVGDTIQTIANENTAPAAVVFSSPTSETGALSITPLASMAYLGLWIRRVFPPAGVVSVQEDFQLVIKYEGAA